MLPPPRWIRASALLCRKVCKQNKVTVAKKKERDAGLALFDSGNTNDFWPFLRPIIGMKRSYHICKVVCTTNILARNVRFSSQLPIMTFTYHQGLYDKEPFEEKEIP